MNSTMQPAFGDRLSGDKDEFARQLGNIGWAVFFIWVGIAMLAAVPWGWFFLGVGSIILATQIVRWQMDMKIEGFWVAYGVVLLVGGVWTVLDLPWSLGPILVILLGAVLLGRATMTLLHRA